MKTLDTTMTVMQIIFFASPLLIAVATLFLAWWRFKVFRVRESVINATLDVSSRRCSPSYNALNVVASLTNVSRVASRVNRFEWSVFVLAPHTDDAIETKIAEYAPYMEVIDSRYEFPWNVNYHLVQQNPGISLEPGESNAISMSLAIPDWIEAVEVLLELDGPPGIDGSPMYWEARQPHDISKERKDGNQTQA